MIYAGSLNKLKQTVFEHTRQYRHNNDTSSSLFHPEKGFVYACDTKVLAKALEEYETSLPSLFGISHSQEAEERALLMEGSKLLATQEASETTRDFIQATLCYLIAKGREEAQESSQDVLVPLQYRAPGLALVEPDAL